MKLPKIKTSAAIFVGLLLGSIGVIYAVQNKLSQIGCATDVSWKSWAELGVMSLFLLAIIGSCSGAITYGVLNLPKYICGVSSKYREYHRDPYGKSYFWRDQKETALEIGVCSLFVLGAGAILFGISYAVGYLIWRVAC